MKNSSILILFQILISAFSHADCSSAVSSRIKNNQIWGESDRSRLMDDCEKYQIFRLNVKDNPKGAYALNPGDFSCRKREDYVNAYNWVLERGGQYNPASIDGANKLHARFKTCEIIKTPTLVAMRTQKDPADPIVEILYHDQYSVYFLHEGWIHKDVLIPYDKLLSRRVK